MRAMLLVAVLVAAKCERGPANATVECPPQGTCGPARVCVDGTCETRAWCSVPNPDGLKCVPLEDVHVAYVVRPKPAACGPVSPCEQCGCRKGEYCGREPGGGVLCEPAAECSREDKVAELSCVRHRQMAREHTDAGGGE